MKKILIVLVVMMISVLDVFAQKNPVFNNGFQYELEAGTFGGSMAFSYKFAKRFSLGAGYWYGVYYWDSDNINKYVGDSYMQNVTKSYNYNNTLVTKKDYEETTSFHQGRPNSRLTNQMFLTGQIRPMNTWFSLLLGANVGYETMQLDDYWYPYYGDKQQVFFVTPFTGFSFRMKNFYINLKGGLNMVDKIKPENSIITEEKDINYPVSNCGKVTTTTELPDIDISSLYAVMNFTWTLNFGHGYREKQRIIAYRNEHPKVKKYRDGHGWDVFFAILDGACKGLNEFSNQMNSYYSSNGYSTGGYNTGSIDMPTLKYAGASGNAPAFVPQNYDKTYTMGDFTFYEKNNNNGTTTRWMISNSCYGCHGDGTCPVCHGYGVYYNAPCQMCNQTGKCTTCAGSGHAYMVSEVNSNGDGTVYINGEYLTTEQIQSEAAERAANGGLTDAEKYNRDRNDEERHDYVCKTCKKNYLDFETSLNQMKINWEVYGKPYDKTQKERLQADMREYRQRCPDWITSKSNLEDWNTD